MMRKCFYKESERSPSHLCKENSSCRRMTSVFKYGIKNFTSGVSLIHSTYFFFLLLLNRKFRSHHTRTHYIFSPVYTLIVSILKVKVN